MAKQKRLATKDDIIVKVNIPISDEEIANRQRDYDLLDPKRFATRYNHMLFQPTTFTLNGLTHPIQYKRIFR